MKLNYTIMAASGLTLAAIGLVTAAGRKGAKAPELTSRECLRSGTTVELVGVGWERSAGTAYLAGHTWDRAGHAWEVAGNTWERSSHAPKAVV